MISTILWVVLLLVVVGLILTVYGDSHSDLFCFYVGIGMEMIAALVLLLIVLAL